jgi:DNA-binding transcriptional regulator YhcF (GntR family)
MISVNIDEKSRIPKYRQIINSIISDIEKGLLQIDFRLPSINEMSEEYYLSRDTVEKAYGELRDRGRIISVPGKGYFINKTDEDDKIRIFFLVNKLSGYKKMIYDSFIETLGPKAKVDFFIYHNDAKLFEKLIKQNVGLYNYYVVNSHFYDQPENLLDILRSIPKKKLILLDKMVDGFTQEDGALVYQNYSKDIENALVNLENALSKYKQLVLVFPEKSYYPLEIKNGFINFCNRNNFPHKIIKKVDLNDFEEGNAYIVLEEKDLLPLLKLFKESNYKPGEEIGVISYNEDPLKEFLLEGLTVISTDHNKMGQEAAEIILNKKIQTVEVPFQVIERRSL